MRRARRSGLAEGSGTEGCALLLGGGPLDARVAADADLDPLRLALLGLGDADLENAVVELRLHLVGSDALGQRERPREAAERALDPVVALVAVLMLGLALA